MKTGSEWPRITELVTGAQSADVALLGLPMEAKSVTPGRYDLAPQVVRKALHRFGTYEVETGKELSVSIRDYGDLPLQGVTPAIGYDPIRQAVRHCTAAHGLTLLLGGHNAITRPAVHGLGGVILDKVGLITLDAHFDLRETKNGLMNGNPIRALLEDGMPGRNICQIGLAPFANTAKMHADALASGIGVYTVAQAKSRGIVAILQEALVRLDHVDALMIDFDIDVIDRSQCPGAPGARPGGMPVDMFFEAARYLGAQEKVKLVDLTEFDPSIDVGEITALTAGRWVCELLAGYEGRG